MLMIIAGVVVVLFLAGKIWRGLEERSLARADQLELAATYDRWIEAGRPEGEKLAKFMNGRNQYLTATNCSFIINGTNFTTQFALKQNMSGWQGDAFCDNKPGAGVVGHFRSTKTRFALT
jgi:hypothetical protein